MGDIACKDGLQVALQIESCEGIKESIQYVLSRRPIQCHEAKCALSQRPSPLHRFTFRIPKSLANPTRLLGKGDFTVSS